MKAGGKQSSAFTLVSCSVYYSSLMMDAICSSETSVDFQWSTRRYIPEDNNLHNYRHENFKSYMTQMLFNNGWKRIFYLMHACCIRNQKLAVKIRKQNNSASRPENADNSHSSKKSHIA
jgi:hypothetical protein